MDMLIKRVTRRDDMTQGVIIANGNIAFGVTMELPWKDNEPQKSCVPSGIYQCDRFYSPSFKIWTYKLAGVENRDFILLHPANWTRQLRGCIAVGHGFDEMNGEQAITQSTKEFNEFMRYQDGVDKFTLTIIWV